MNGATVRGTGVAMLAALAMLAVGCGGESAGGGGFSMPPTPVEVATAEPQRVTDRFEAVGTLEARDAITVVSEIDGVVVQLPFEEGGPILKGALIAKLDDAQLAAEVQRAEAIRDQRQTAYDRIQSVVDQGAGTPQDLDDARAALKVSEAELSLARTRLSKTRIRAPFSGLLGTRRVTRGAFLRAGTSITDLARVDELRLRFSAPERYVGQLKRGARVTVTTPAFPGLALEGTIDVIEPIVDAGTRSARFVARVPNLDQNLRPGMSANVTAVLSEREDALTIPSEAVFVEGGQAYVYRIGPDSTVARSPLTLGTRLSDAVEVITGLTPGTQVVRTGHQKLFDGAKVMPVASQPPAAAEGGGGQTP